MGAYIYLRVDAERHRERPGGGQRGIAAILVPAQQRSRRSVPADLHVGYAEQALLDRKEQRDPGRQCPEHQQDLG